MSEQKDEQTIEQPSGESKETLARRHLIDALNADLIGPYGDELEEVLTISPYRWYLNGFLAPKADRVRPEEPGGAKGAQVSLGESPHSFDDQDERGAGDFKGDDDAENEDEPKRKNFFPASIGMTFLVADTTGGTASINVQWGDYLPWSTNDKYDAIEQLDAIPGVGEQLGPRTTHSGSQDSDEASASLDLDAVNQPNAVREQLNDEAAESEKGAKNPIGQRVVWKRAQRTSNDIEISLEVSDKLQPYDVPGSGGLRLHVRVAATPSNTGSHEDARAVSVFLVNERDVGMSAQRRAMEYVFQVEMSVACSVRPLVRSNPRDAASDDEDRRIADLQYRDVKTYAVGHNIAVKHRDDGRNITLRTCWTPEADANFVKANAIDGVTVSMKQLAACDTAEQIDSALRHLPAAYGEWIAERDATDFETKQRNDTRDNLMKRAREANKRIVTGIEILKSDADARRAFCLTNLAMSISAERREEFQRIEAGKSDDTDADANEYEPSWRLFQLAFLLMNIGPTLRNDSQDEQDLRKTVDLLYFPTGGGKTEAYFGVAAFTMITRRMFGQDRDDKGNGVAIILRYTLRLLTLDQLERAAILTCALETVRSMPGNRALLGDTPFRVGLWVGRTSTANTVKDAHEAFSTARASSWQDAPFPLKRCPNCGEEISRNAAKKVTLSSGAERLNVYCKRRSCVYCEAKAKDSPQNYGIPVEFVDEQLYQFAPAFLIGTVDKFAMVPWKEQAGLLFGRAAGQAKDGTFATKRRMESSGGRHYEPLSHGLAPPQLIIQDEVHLITGPLGSMVGMYEFMIEELCRAETRGRHGTELPRIIASTATVRRASHQLRRLFGRDRVDVFPPQGTEPDDSFFAVPDKGRPSRRYLGIAATGRSMKKVLRRVYTTLLAAANWNIQKSDFPNADSYMSLLGYFNSLRELGGMRMLVDDEVFSAAAQAEFRMPAHIDPKVHPNRYFVNRTLNAETRELTSRVSTSEISDTRMRLGLNHRDKKSVDVALASNMISVGIDIGRLGLMVVSGQPKSTSEYIQATSRVGRRYPGLVVTCFNIHRARDRSQYEHFERFHSAFYRHVESSSLTPYAIPAVERALAGVVVGIMRHHSADTAAPTGVAGALSNGRLRAELRQRLATRVGGVSTDARKKDVEDRFDMFLDNALKKVTAAHTAGGQIVYGQFEGSGFTNTKKLLHVTDPVNGRSGGVEGALEAPTSMRDVEPSAPIWLDERPM